MTGRTTSAEGQKVMTRKHLRRIRQTFHVSLMPGWGWHFWFGPSEYGDLVIWIGRIWIAASWSDEHPWQGDLA